VSDLSRDWPDAPLCLGGIGPRRFLIAALDWAQRPAKLLRFAADLDKPNRQHIHCVVRTPNGNDYGKDILRQHYQAHPHRS